MLTFPSEPHHMQHPRRKLLVWPRRTPKIDFLRPSPNLNYCFFLKIPQILSASGHAVLHVPSPISNLGFLLCSSHRSFSFRESMPLLRESVTHWPINWQSALIPSPSQELFFWSLFCKTDNVRESLELAEGTYFSHMTALIPLGTLRSLFALNTLPTNQGPTYRPATQRDTFSLSFLHACY